MRVLSITSLVVAVVLGLAGLGRTQEGTDALRAVLKRAVEARRYFGFFLIKFDPS